MNAHFSISDAFFNSWKALKSQIWILVGLFVGFYIIYFTLSIFLMPSSTTTFSFSIKLIIGYIVMLLFSLLFNLGYTKKLFPGIRWRRAPIFSIREASAQNFQNACCFTFCCSNRICRFLPFNYSGHLPICAVAILRSSHR